jgi:hypothetical protein
MAIDPDVEEMINALNARIDALSTTTTDLTLVKATSNFNSIVNAKIAAYDTEADLITFLGNASSAIAVL